MLQASTTISVERAPILLAEVCEHYGEHGTVAFDGRSGTIRTPYGEAFVTAEGETIRLAITARDKVGLSYMKIGLSEHLAEMSAFPISSSGWEGDGNEQDLPFFRVMTVTRSQRLSPHMQRVTLTGGDLAGFANAGLHVRLVFPPRGRTPVWPRLASNGRIAWPEGEDAVTARVYTLRRVDRAAGLVDIDIVLHPGASTPGSNFAETARPGDIVGVMGPGGDGVPPSRSLFLFGDETALPAIARILEELPQEASAQAVVEVDGPADMLTLTSRARTHVRYIDRQGAPAGTTGLLAEAARALTRQDVGETGYIWAGCEFNDFKAIRSFVRGTLQVPKDRHLVVAYWRRGQAGTD
ncbi:siderophore-interacting protein [Fulvimarina sp. 2208YS6-2-32]|uniref:Siderophore-interacting protein n=1 Tax=Fulvimarina uroteuthidis TaxID=3098149 RepID=A0ABU5I0I9_9HYPH|nr:siderophore-interacting protein [Fulvimarina sp. 2208YS6-2-32]MDY8108898.1 siderophore-interacting protein [Fulvimarina sp. 2208YS6-2-32]